MHRMWEKKSKDSGEKISEILALLEGGAYNEKKENSGSEERQNMKVISTEKAPAAIGPYSQAMVFGNLMISSGQIPIDPATGEIAGTTIQEQAEQVMKNIGAVLEEAGANYTDVMKTTCFLADMSDFAAFNEVYGKYFTGKPARSCVAVKTLPKNVLCEVEVIVALA